MFALGISGWLILTAIPLLLFYSLLALTLSISAYFINKCTDSFRFNITAPSLIGHTCLAWLTSVSLFFLLAILNSKFTQHSGNTIFSLYPLIQQIVGILIFFFLCKSSLCNKKGQPEIPKSKRNLLSAGLAVIPTTIFVLAARTWHLLR